MVYKEPKIISEIGCNHKGEIEIAKELIDIASQCESDVVKFQKRNPKELLTEEQYNAPHPNPTHAYGNTYGEHREFLELSKEEHYELKEYCDKKNIIYSTSVWDVTSAKEVVGIKPELIKVPSACNTNFDLLTILRDEYKGEIHLSFGMTTHAEEKKIIDFFSINQIAKDRLVIYSCTSGYPVPFKDVNMLEILRLKDMYKEKVKAIGFSGHHLGIAIDIAAYTLGAEWIERHVTLDRTWKGTDHAASLEPQGLKKLVRNLHATHKALNFKSEEILPIEKVQRDKLKYRG